jgi:hypothetical protein
MATQFNNKASKSKSSKPAPAPAPVPAAKVVAPPAKVAAKPGKGGYQPTQDEIATRAFEIYVSEGCREGTDLDNWLRAERELRSQGLR